MEGYECQRMGKITGCVDQGAVTLRLEAIALGAEAQAMRRERTGRL
jgi:hypothetical protein